MRIVVREPFRHRSSAYSAWSLCAAACSGGGLFRQYQYEEEIYLSLDGTATVYVNSSICRR